MSNIITSEFGGVTLPGAMITPSGMTWSADQVFCTVIPEEIQIPAELEAVAGKIFSIKNPKVDNQVYHYRRATSTSERLEVEVGHSWYRYNLLHTAFEPKMVEEHPEFLETLLRHVQPEEIFDLDSLGGSSSGGVGITTVVIFADNTTVMVHRSKEVSVNADIDHTALAEGVNFDEGESGHIDLAAVAARSAVEELNLPITRQDVLFLGLAVDGRYWWPGVLAQVKVPLTWGQVKEQSEAARDRWEHSSVRFIPYTPEGIAEELRYALEPGKGVTGFGAIALLESGIYDFGQEEMERAFRNIALQT